MSRTKFIFVSGGVISGIGKGVATSAIALLLKSRGFKVTAIKADPYLNVDAGTLNPIEHGEVFVLHDDLTYLPIPSSIGEMKSKPAQMSILQLASSGIHTDFVLARSSFALDDKRREKIAISCGIEPENIISAPDVENIYQIPLNFENQNLSDKILSKLNTKPRRSDLADWKVMVNRALTARKVAKIAMVGKYFTTGDFTLSDAYLSVIESIKHASPLFDFKPKMKWIDSADIEKEGVGILANFDGIVVPGGYGSRAVEGIVAAIKFARENKIPYFGLCYGMQQAAVEFARNVLGYKDANTTEINPKTKHPIIDVMLDQKESLKYQNWVRLSV